MTNVLFSIILAIFVFILLFTGIRSRKNVKDQSDFILAGRGIGFWMSVLSIVSIGFAGTAIALNPFYTMNFGFGNSLLFGALVAIIGYGTYGLVMGKFVRISGAQTVPEWLEVRYNSTTRNIVSITTMVGLCGILANNIMSMVSVISAYTGWPSWAILTGTFAVILCFAYTAGMWGVTTSGFVQMIIGIIIVPTFTILCINKWGGPSFVAANWPVGNWLFNGGTGNALPVIKATYPSVLTMFILYSFFLVWGNSYYWTRVATCRNAKTSRSSFIVAGIIMFLIFYLPLSYIGVYGVTSVENGMSFTTGIYGAISRYFPAVIGCLTVIAAVAASISTAATSLIGATATASRDIYGRMIRPNASPEQKFKVTRFIILLVAALTWVVCMFPGGAQTIFAISSAFLGPPAVLILFGNLFPGFNNKGALSGALCGGLVMLVLFILELFSANPLAKYCHSGVIGLIVTVAACIIGGFMGKAKYYGEKTWSVKANGNNREKVALEPQDYDVLEMCRLGHTHMSDFTDALGRDAGDVSLTIERLDRNGFIEREGLRWSSFYIVHLTEAGKKALPPLSDEKQKMADQGVNELYLEIMNKIKEGMPALTEWAKGNHFSSTRMSATITHLERVGYVLQNKGWSTPIYELTAKGNQLLNEYSA